jgi:UPF0716 family protein affecting phage T7 exclusion
MWPLVQEVSVSLDYQGLFITTLLLVAASVCGYLLIRKLGAYIENKWV